MINEDAFIDIQNEYERQLFEWKSNFSKVMIIIAISFLVVILSLVLIVPSLMSNTGYIVGFSIMGFLIIISLLAGMQYKSEKPFFEFLIKKIIEDIYKDKDTVEYYSFVKNEKQAIAESGLFPKGAFMSAKCKIKTKDLELYFNKNIYFTDGKTTHQYFYGYYMVFAYSTKEIIQIRSKGKPYFKEIKWQRIDTDKFRIFLDENCEYRDEYLPFLEKIKKLQAELQPKAIYVALTKENMHFAYEPQSIIKRTYNVSYQSFKELYKEIENIIKLHDVILEK